MSGVEMEEIIMIDRWKLYDLIYNKANKLLKQYNPCNIRIKESNDRLFGKLICNNEYMCKRNGESLCCSGCKYLGHNGCTIKCLECKVGWCWQGKTCKDIFEDDLLHVNMPRTFIHKMDRLRKIMKKYQLNKIRTSKEEIFSEIREKHPLFYWQKTWPTKALCI